LETYRNDAYTEALGLTFLQDNLSYSSYGTIRGLHFQREPYAQAKLVRCPYGEILDVAVDIREDSPSFGKHVSVVLSSVNQKQFFIPAGFAHGFVVLSKEAIVEYKCSNYYHPDSDAGIFYNDEQLGISWMIPIEERILSEKDLSLPCLGSITRS
ncbi:MAG: dTDP-4-dehydrorhamnose 3,5-epimerase, partial [Methanobacteriaceae archaeon]|nr:dTDP-4-dehydrorhamnose 3,5-epimerase [Methanobacteriaceae archaeon]